ncbi:hypothetical protein TSUD_213060 [Trifolium subterraneum]|uniref:WIYLD domain-containing protein n=1 Tax=Trifolium subterraneum TaxID=3900 RepID=A0A2Z6NJ59_TRISU|nr:hypothetical protein TSUD_213060 [Trifolium subterraneum]
MAPRRRQPRKMVGNTRMDAALDAMRQLGFEEKLVKETVEELLDVYEGLQGWPFIEEGSYKLLIETLLCVEDKDSLPDDARKDGVGETSSAATPATGITDVGSSGLLAHDSISRGSNDMESASQTNDHLDSAQIGNLEVEAGAMDNVPTERGGEGESNQETFGSNVEDDTIVKSSMIESSKTSDKLPRNGRKPYHGWITSDDTEDELVYFPLPKHVQKLIGKSVAPERRWRKSRWDEKPDDM